MVLICFVSVITVRWELPVTTRPTTLHVCKTRGCQCSFRLLMIGDVSPETCWASYKIIQFWHIIASCWIFLYELYYDARIHEHQEAAVGWTVKGEAGRDEQHHVCRTMRKTVHVFHEVLMYCVWGSQLRYLTKFIINFHSFWHHKAESRTAALFLTRNLIPV